MMLEEGFQRIPEAFWTSRCNSRIHDYHDSDDGRNGNSGGPIPNDYVAGHDLERHESGLKDEEIVARGEAKGLVNITAGEADKRRRYGKIGDHLVHACRCVCVSRPARWGKSVAH
jgi:hypothetical protein